MLITVYAHSGVLYPQKHGKMYKDELEELRRYTIWRSKRAFVNEHNRHADRFGYTLAMNKFSDMVDDEITVKFKGLEMVEPCLLYTSPSPRDATLSRMPSSA